MSSRGRDFSYLSNSLLSEHEIRVVDIVSYQFGQYEGKDWRKLAAGLGFNVPDCMKHKVRLTETEIDNFDNDCATIHKKLHLLLNRFVLNCRMVGLEINLVEHLVEILDGGLVFCTPHRILIETILFEKFKNFDKRR